MAHVHRYAPLARASPRAKEEMAALEKKIRERVAEAKSVADAQHAKQMFVPRDTAALSKAAMDRMVHVCTGKAVEVLTNAGYPMEPKLTHRVRASVNK